MFTRTWVILERRHAKGSLWMKVAQNGNYESTDNVPLTFLVKSSLDVILEKLIEIHHASSPHPRSLRKVGATVEESTTFLRPNEKWRHRWPVVTCQSGGLFKYDACKDLGPFDPLCHNLAYFGILLRAPSPTLDAIWWGTHLPYVSTIPIV